MREKRSVENRNPLATELNLWRMPLPNPHITRLSRQLLCIVLSREVGMPGAAPSESYCGRRKTVRYADLMLPNRAISG